MKTLLIVLYFSFVYTATQAQELSSSTNKPNKEETIRWIVSKLQNNVSVTEYTNTPIADRADNYLYGYNISIVDSIFEIKWERITTYHTLKGTTVDSHEDKNAVFNINEIVHFEFTHDALGGGYSPKILLRLYTLPDKIKYTYSIRYDGKSIIKNETMVDKKIDIPLNMEAEVNLQNRMTKALDTLIHYNKKFEAY